MTKRKHVSPEALDASLLPKQRKPIPHAFVLDAISTLSPYTRPMFGCLAIYVKDKIVLILREKPKSTADNGVWLATTQEHHQSLRREFPNMRSIQVLGKRVTGWQVLPVDALTLNQRHCGHASLCWLATLGSAGFRAHERRSPDQERMEDRRNRSKARRNTRAQLTSTRYGRSVWRCPAWRRAQHTAHPRARFVENCWRACLLIVRRSRVRLPFASVSTTAPNCLLRLPMFTT